MLMSVQQTTVVVLRDASTLKDPTNALALMAMSWTPIGKLVEVGFL